MYKRQYGTGAETDQGAGQLPRDISCLGKLDVALANIGSFPTVPDFASEARYGDLLIRQLFLLHV